jgi:hypothetical protein
MLHRRCALGLVLVLSVAGLGFCGDPDLFPGPEEQGRNGFKADDPTGPPKKVHGDYYLDTVQPVLNNRCVVCHACYNAPCQLKLSSYEGLQRGGSKKQLYDPSRLLAMKPTRLHIDARTADEWHDKKGFFPVVHHETQNATANMQSLLYRLVEHGRNHQLKNPYVPGAATTFSGIAAESRECAKDAKELDAYLAKLPEQGMPFGCPAIGSTDYQVITDWLLKGAPGPSPEARAALEAPSSGDAGRALLKKWESFFNDPSPKMRLTARYIYEHLFLAELSIEGIPGDFWRLVRSRTAAPQPVDEIATILPYDDPGGPFHYRLVKIIDTIVHKTHTVYQLDDARMARIKQLFLDSDWGPGPIPAPCYDNKTAANPFLAFARIPPRARYQFLLDTARTSIQTFINGPVCYGQTALNVIRDHFFVLFLDPDTDLSITDPKFLIEAGPSLQLPTTGRSNMIYSWYYAYKLKQMKYTKLRDKYYAAQYPQGLGLDAIWDGDKTKTAVLTVYRHFDNGTVLDGAVGEIPKTVLLLDYPILERIHYNLVAGFDVFGNVFHQLSVRQYMDNLRVEAEDCFLSFLPKEVRAKIRASWSQGLPASMKMSLENKLWGADRDTQVVFTPGVDPVKEMVTQVLTQHLPAAARGPSDPLHALELPNVMAPPSSVVPQVTNQAELEAALKLVAGTHGEFVRVLPEVSFVRVLRPGKESLVYTLVRNRAHLNVSFVLVEQFFFDPEHDTLNVMRGFVGSYPNFFFVVQLDDAQDFVRQLLEMKEGDGSLANLVSTYGVRRRDPILWPTLDFFHGKFYADSPLEAGLFDINRYQNF